MDFEAWRAEYPTLERKTYLNTCSLGLLSRRSRAAVGTFLDLWEEHGASAWYTLWLGEVAALRGKVARLLGASPEEIAILPSVSAALSVMASSIDSRGRPEVVASDLDFPTLPYQWLAKPGCVVRFAESPDGIGVPIDRYASLLGPRTAWLATSHVYFTTGYVQDVEALAALAREAGARSLIDAYHGTGQVPTDVRALGVDALVTGGLKWLLGGPGVAFLYVRRDLASTLAPTITSWFAHARQFEFDARSMEFAPDARRFELGTPSVASVYAASAGLEAILEIGPAAIRRRTLELVRDLEERLLDAKFRVALPDPAHRSGIVPVLLRDPAGAVARLASEGIVVDKRPGRIRVSPYFYNTERDNERFVEALARMGAA